MRSNSNATGSRVLWCAQCQPVLPPKFQHKYCRKQSPRKCCCALATPSSTQGRPGLPSLSSLSDMSSNSHRTQFRHSLETIEGYDEEMSPPLRRSNRVTSRQRYMPLEQGELEAELEASVDRLWDEVYTWARKYWRPGMPLPTITRLRMEPSIAAAAKIVDEIDDTFKTTIFKTKSSVEGRVNVPPASQRSNKRPRDEEGQLPEIQNTTPSRRSKRICLRRKMS